MLLLLLPSLSRAQQQLGPEFVDSALLTRYWPASWIAHPTASLSDYGVFHFRRNFTLSERPEHFVVHVSADNRYRMYVNGHQVVEGPSTDDLDHWRFETVDIGPYLVAGDNALAAVVWNFGEHRPVFQWSFATSFLFMAADSAHHDLNTGSETPWKVVQNPAYAPEMEGIRQLRSYHVVGPGERLDGSAYPWGWQAVDHDDSAWPEARTLMRAHPAAAGTVIDYGLMPRELPLMESGQVRFEAVRLRSGLEAGLAFLEGDQPVEVPANDRVSLLLDNGHLTNAYPVLALSGGKGAKVTLTYAESLYYPEGNHNKGNRNEISGKTIKGMQDIFLPDGGVDRNFSPLWFRTYRYVQVDIVTGNEPLVLLDFYGRYRGYPLAEKGSFASSDPSLSDIWNVGWRTARLCAGETYYDCPYYEQLQYVGDTRIQALISLYVAGDSRLMRKSIDSYDHSRVSYGLTQSRYPAARPAQIIPPYSLFWVNMVHDYWMHVDDPAFVEAKLPGLAEVLRWYREQVREDNRLIGHSPYWNFVDWAWPWSPENQAGGVPDLQGGSSIISLQVAYALADAGDLYQAYNRIGEAVAFRAWASELRRQVYATCWDEEKGLLADTPAKKTFSQHANILGILTNAIPQEDQTLVMDRLLTDASITQATFYFKFYLFEALHKLGWSDQYSGLLDPWRAMLDLGLTTFAEEPDPTRSDCHAWSASPNYHLLALVCGIRPDAPGFGKVTIAPSLGELDWVEGNVPHPLGPIQVRFERGRAGGLTGSVELPDGLTGTLEWNGNVTVLRSGTQDINVGAN